MNMCDGSAMNEGDRSTETTPLNKVVPRAIPNGSNNNALPSGLLPSPIRISYAIGLVVAFAAGAIVGGVTVPRIFRTTSPVPDDDVAKTTKELNYSGPYRILEVQSGAGLLDHYNFYEGPDSVGSNGYNDYVSRHDAFALGIVNVTMSEGEEVVYMGSSSTADGPRHSIRLEGKTRFDRGLFVMDLRHLPTGCGAWPAFWLTDVANWPNNGEIDIIEAVNHQTTAKTALHTSDRCDMFGHIAPWDMTGHFDRTTGMYDTFTGLPNWQTSIEADNCWNLAPHQWANMGCVVISDTDGTLGAPLNAKGGGIFAMEWDPANGYIRSWAWSPRDKMPGNLMRAMESPSSVIPTPEYWGPPYAKFAIGPATGCSSDHFKNMSLVINLAFCGNVAGNRYFADCPNEAADFNVDFIPMKSCNAYLDSQPKSLDEAFWKIRSVHVWEREVEPMWNNGTSS